MNEHVSDVKFDETLDHHSDEALRNLIGTARQLLADRDAQRQCEAAAQIRRIARESGLNVSIGKRPRKRGRPSAK